MSIAFYLDENVSGILVKALLRRKVDALTVQMDGLRTFEDPAVFRRSIELNRVLVSNDVDMISLAADCMKRGKPFPGLIFLYAAPVRFHLEALEYFGADGLPEEFANCIWYLPL